MHPARQGEESSIEEQEALAPKLRYLNYEAARLNYKGGRAFGPCSCAPSPSRAERRPMLLSNAKTIVCTVKHRTNVQPRMLVSTFYLPFSLTLSLSLFLSTLCILYRITLCMRPRVARRAGNFTLPLLLRLLVHPKFTTERAHR